MSKPNFGAGGVSGTTGSSAPFAKPSFAIGSKPKTISLAKNDIKPTIRMNGNEQDDFRGSGTNNDFGKNQRAAFNEGSGEEDAI